MVQENKNVVNFNEKLELFENYWSPKIIASLNDYHFKLVKVKGDFIWHDHQTTDEAYSPFWRIKNRLQKPFINSKRR